MDKAIVCSSVSSASVTRFCHRQISDVVAYARRICLVGDLFWSAAMFVGPVWEYLYLILGTEPIFFLHWVGRCRELSSFRPSSFHFPHFFFSSASRGGDSNRPGEVHGFPSRVWFACCFFALLACVVVVALRGWLLGKVQAIPQIYLGRRSVIPYVH